MHFWLLPQEMHQIVLFMSKEEQTLEGSCSTQKKNGIMTLIFLTHKLKEA